MEEQERAEVSTKVVQVRSETSGLQNFDTLKEAFKQSKIDESIWKISFTIFTGERVRLIRQEDKHFGVVWIYASIEEDVEEVLSDLTEIRLREIRSKS